MVGKHVRDVQREDSGMLRDVAGMAKLWGKGNQMVYDYKNDKRFEGIIPLKTKTVLSSPTMHGEEMKYMQEAYQSGWMTTVGENINRLEEEIADFVGMNYAVGLSCGTAALHLAVKLAAEKLYGSSSGLSTPSGLGSGGSLKGIRVFCSDVTFDATVNPILYEGGEPVFIDSEADTWNMSPQALEQAFGIYPEVRLVVLVHLYGTPAKIDEIRKICSDHHALLIEDAAESFGATYKGRQTGSFGDYGVISFNGNKIITGSSGGMLLAGDGYSANKARKWSTQSREAAPWYEHEELGYNYRMSNVIAGVVRGQLPYLEEHIEKKREIYERYEEGLKGLPVKMNPFDSAVSQPNWWLSCLIIDGDSMCKAERSARSSAWEREKGKSCPDEILEALKCFGAEGRPVWKPMHLQPMYRNHGFVTAEGFGRGNSNAYAEGCGCRDVATDLFNKGVCLPSDVKMSKEQQDVVIEVVRRCFE